MAKQKKQLATTWLFEKIKKSDRRMWESILEESVRMEMENLESVYYEDRLTADVELGEEQGLEF
jgi:hypothetical protein